MTGPPGEETATHFKCCNRKRRREFGIWEADKRVVIAVKSARDVAF